MAKAATNRKRVTSSPKRARNKKAGGITVEGMIDVRSPAEQARVTGEHVGRFLSYELGLAHVARGQVKVAQAISGKLMDRKTNPKPVQVLDGCTPDVVTGTPTLKTVRLSGMPAFD